MSRRFGVGIVGLLVAGLIAWSVSAGTSRADGPGAQNGASGATTGPSANGGKCQKSGGSASASASTGHGHQLRGKIVSVTPGNATGGKITAGSITVEMMSHHHKNKGAANGNAAPAPVTKTFSLGANTTVAMVGGHGGASTPATIADLKAGEHVALTMSNGTVSAVNIMNSGHSHHHHHQPPTAPGNANQAQPKPGNNS